MTRALMASLLLLAGCGSNDLTVEEERHHRDMAMAPADLTSASDLSTSVSDLLTSASDLAGAGGTTGSGLFPSTAPWYQDITNAPKDAQSDTAIAALQSKGGWGNGKMQIDFSITVQHANASTPMMVSVPRIAS